MIWSINAFTSKTSRDMWLENVIDMSQSYVIKPKSIQIRAFIGIFLKKLFVLFTTKNGKTSTSMQTIL